MVFNTSDVRICCCVMSSNHNFSHSSTTNLQSKVSLTPFHNGHVAEFTIRGIKKQEDYDPTRPES